MSIVRVWLDLWSIRRNWTTVSATIFLYLTLTIILIVPTALYSPVHLVLDLENLHLNLSLYFFFKNAEKNRIKWWSDLILGKFGLILHLYSCMFRMDRTKIYFFTNQITKIHIFWEGHKILQNLQLTFDWH